MERLDKVKKLEKKGRYREAAVILDSLLSKQGEDDSLLYLRAILAMRLRDYEKAREFLERAIFIKRKHNYVRTKGMLFFEILDFQGAASEFEECISLKPRDFICNFFLSMCYMFLDDPRSAEYLKKARSINKKKTKSFLKSFYLNFFKSDNSLDVASRRIIEEKLKKLS